LAARGKTARDTAWQTAKMDSAEKKYIRKAYLTTLTPKCLRIFIQPHFTDIGLDYFKDYKIHYLQVRNSRKWKRIGIELA